MLQVHNIANCIKVALDFVSPEGLSHSVFQTRNRALMKKKDILQVYQHNKLILKANLPWKNPLDVRPCHYISITHIYRQGCSFPVCCLARPCT